MYEIVYKILMQMHPLLWYKWYTVWKLLLHFFGKSHVLLKKITK